MPDSSLAQNLAALRKTQSKYHHFLTAHPEPEATPLAVSVLAADDGEKILVIDGQSQDSRRAPGRAVQVWLDAELSRANGPAPGSSVWLFGLGSPLTLAELLKRIPRVTVLEPRPQVTWKALEILDLRTALEEGRLTFQTLASLRGAVPPPRPLLLAHPPSSRARRADYLRLQNFLRGQDQKTLPGSRDPRIYIISPLAGGSEPMGGYLLRAGQELGLPIAMIGWGEKTRSLAQSAQAGSDQAARSLWTQAAQRVRLALDEFKPDLIVALAQAPLTAETLAFLKKESDGLWAFWFVEDFRVFRYVEEVAPCYDLFFHLQGDLLEASLARWGLNRAWCLPPAADPVFFQPRAQVPAQYQAAVSLMGAGYPNRRQILTSLYNDYWLKSGHPAETLKIFGSGWEGLEPPLAERLFEGGRRVSPQECAWIYAGSQVNLNIHSSLTPGLNPQSAFVNPRTFELAACGALQLVDRRPLLAGLFSEEEVAVFDHPSQLPEKIEYYLARPKLRQTMGEAARARVLADHQYTHRLEFMIKRAQSPFLEEITG